MGFFDRQGWERTLLLAIGAAFTTGVVAQEYDTASVPFLVNVNAAVSASDGVTQRQISVTANQEAILSIPLQKTDGVRFFGTQRRANAPIIVSSRNGKVTVNLPSQSYRNAEVLLYTVNGKRILRSNASASNTANSITRPNLATGVYLLSVRGAGGNAVTSRLTHSGGGLNISVAFGGEDVFASAGKRLAKEAASGDWTITVSAAGYVDSTYTLRPAAGDNNTLQNITLRKVPDGEYTVTVSAGIGALGGGSYAPGTNVSIYAGDAPFGHKFIGWTTESNGVILASATSTATTFIMPANAVAVKASFEAVPTYALTVSSAGAGASGSGNYVDGATVTITVGTAPAGQRFKNWTTESSGVVFADANSATTTFTMPANAVTVTANFQANTYKVTILSVGAGAVGSGDYSPGATVNITAGTAPTGCVFQGWTASSSDIVFADANSATTMFTMPSAMVTVTANFSSPAAIMFLIDHTRSMTTSSTAGSPGTDVNGNRFRVTRALVDTIAKAYPGAQIGIAVFGEGLVLDYHWDNNLVGFKGVTNSFGGPNQSYLPIKALNAPAASGGWYAADTGATWLSVIRGMFNVPASSAAKSTLRKPTESGQPLSDTIVAESGGTNISIAFEAAIEAFAAIDTVYTPKRNRYIIFLSDGDPEIFGGNKQSCDNLPSSTNPRCMMQDDFVNGTVWNAATQSYASIPTTYTVYLTTDYPLTPPPKLTMMTANIQKNKYSESNPSSSIRALSSTYGSLLTYMMNNIVIPILNNSTGSGSDERE